MRIGSRRASITALLAIALATASTAAFAGPGKGLPLGTPTPIPGPTGGDVCPGGITMLPGFPCWNPDYTGPFVPQDLTFVIAPSPGKLPKRLRQPPDSSGGCDASGCDCGCQ